MKFLNGGWLVRDGYSVKYAANIYDADIDRDGGKLTLYCPFGSPIYNAGMTLDGGILTIEVTSPRENVITTRLINFRKDRSHCPKFQLNETNPAVEIAEDDEKWTFTSGKTTLEIAKDETIDFKYFFDGTEIAHSGWRAKGLVNDPSGRLHVTEQLDLGVGEKIYGLGERFTNFVKNGQSVEIYNEDGGTGTEQAYKNVPFYMSNRNYGLFVDTPAKVEFEIGSEKVSRVQFSVAGEEMTYSVIGGGSMKEILGTYTALTGRAPLVPDWSYGLWLSTSFTTDYDEQTVLDFVDGMAERNIPLSVFHFDCRWMKELEWCNFAWDENKFPDPEGLLKKLHDRGLKNCVWINSYVGQKSPLFEEGAKNGYFIKRTDGSVWQWDKWQAGMAIVDFTNPDAVKWYQGYLKKLVAMGVDCFKTDFGERIPTEDVVYYDGSDPELMHNYYTLLYNKAVYDVLVETKGEDEAILFARSATVGGQQYPVHWGGDCSSNYPSMAESLRAGLSFGMSGFGYWSHDIAGFEDEATPDLYKRWTQFGLLSSHSRYHGSTAYKVPWLYGDEAVDVCREFVELKAKLVPYLKSMAVETHETGLPMMRSMVLEFQDDPTCEDLDTQYMLGSDILVAPIFREDGVARFYVPADPAAPTSTWRNLITGTEYEPGHWYTEQYDYHALPVLVRPGTDPLNVK
ncbi:alpha-xylosidase [Bifidobacterium choloepi]|uniref:alpha-D-xyloside xylohydrolase n=1 Tax=Bifidobacterium choloepi TaxID=2614131 RepID=A0A6I5NJG5_9BIFI|nr:alpha-xylosidase [Bifidobacterium choloepi]NEG70523.1 alpha-xylosidase [Bifidobacterium choloepi]